MSTIKAAKKEFETLSKIFSDHRLGLLHGRIKSKEKDIIMADFVGKKFDILVTTPVVEVGVDIPNANIIIIEAAERFGLAQLHQLRGRVGRSQVQAHCLIFTSKTESSIIKRLKNFTKIHDGFTLAELDLHNRGAGDIYSTQQHGVVELKIASLTDITQINAVQLAVKQFIGSNKKVTDYPRLQYLLSLRQSSDISND